MPKRYDSQMIGACLAATERNLNSCGRHSATDGHDINPARLDSGNFGFVPKNRAGTEFSSPQAAATFDSVSAAGAPADLPEHGSTTPMPSVPTYNERGRSSEPNPFMDLRHQLSQVISQTEQLRSKQDACMTQQKDELTVFLSMVEKKVESAEDAARERYDRKMVEIQPLLETLSRKVDRVTNHSDGSFKTFDKSIDEMRRSVNNSSQDLLALKSRAETFVTHTDLSAGLDSIQNTILQAAQDRFERQQTKLEENWQVREEALAKSHSEMWKDAIARVDEVSKSHLAHNESVKTINNKIERFDDHVQQTPKKLSKLSSDIEARTLQSQKRLEDLEKKLKQVETKLEQKLEELDDNFSRQRSKSQSRFDEQLNDLKNSHVESIRGNVNTVESRLAKLEQRLIEQVGLHSERSELDKRLSGDLTASIKNLEKKVDDETRSKFEGNIMDRLLALEKKAEEHGSLLDCNDAAKANVARLEDEVRDRREFQTKMDETNRQITELNEKIAEERKASKTRMSYNEKNVDRIVQHVQESVHHNEKRLLRVEQCMLDMTTQGLAASRTKVSSNRPVSEPSEPKLPTAVSYLNNRPGSDSSTGKSTNSTIDLKSGARPVVNTGVPPSSSSRQTPHPSGLDFSGTGTGSGPGTGNINDRPAEQSAAAPPAAAPSESTTRPVAAEYGSGSSSEPTSPSGSKISKSLMTMIDGLHATAPEAEPSNESAGERTNRVKRNTSNENLLANSNSAAPVKQPSPSNAPLKEPSPTTVPAAALPVPTPVEQKKHIVPEEEAPAKVVHHLEEMSDREVESDIPDEVADEDEVVTEEQIESSSGDDAPGFQSLLQTSSSGPQARLSPIAEAANERISSPPKSSPRQAASPLATIAQARDNGHASDDENLADLAADLERNQPPGGYEDPMALLDELDDFSD